MLIFIDSSIINPGVVISRGRELITATCLTIPSYRIVNKEKIKHSNIERLMKQLKLIYDLVPEGEKIKAVFIEEPGIRGRDRCSKQSIQQLCHTVGFISGYYSSCSIPVIQLTPSMWKGGKKKEVTEQEITLLYPQVKKMLEDVSNDRKNNAFDALGIFHFVVSNPEFYCFTK